MSNNVTNISTTTASSEFCFTCGFDFGKIIDGIDNKLAGLIFVFLAFTLLCSPCIVMACCYMCRKDHKKHKRHTKKSKYDEVDKADDDESDEG
jgi:hypothetical protein